MTKTLVNSKATNASVKHPKIEGSACHRGDLRSRARMDRTEVSDHLNIQNPRKNVPPFGRIFQVSIDFSGIYSEPIGIYWTLFRYLSKTRLESIFLSSEHVSDDRPSVRPMITVQPHNPLAVWDSGFQNPWSIKPLVHLTFPKKPLVHLLKPLVHEPRVLARTDAKLT